MDIFYFYLYCLIDLARVSSIISVNIFVLSQRVKGKSSVFSVKYEIAMQCLHVSLCVEATLFSISFVEMRNLGETSSCKIMGL